MNLQRGFIDGEYQDGELRGLSFCCGKRGMGKTTEMCRLLCLCLGGVLMFDTLSKHHTVLPGWVVISEPGQLKDYLRSNLGRRFRVLYQPRSGSLDAHFDAVCKVVIAFGWMIFAVDELDKLCGVQFGVSRMPKPFYDLVNYGRHHRVSMIATARRPAQVPRGYTSECLEMRLFKITEELDRQYFEEFIGRETSMRLKGLESFQFLLWRDNHEPELKGGRR